MPLKRPIRRRRKPTTPRWWMGRRLTAYGREAVSVLVLVGTLFLREHQAVPVAKREEDAPPAVWVVDLKHLDGNVATDLPVPGAPFQKQLTTCRAGVHTTINGGCWRRLADDPPCEEAYRWKDGCYLPVMTAERPATSITK